MEREVAVVLNPLYEAIDWTEWEHVQRHGWSHLPDSEWPTDPEWQWTAGYEAGLRAAGLIVYNELARRRLPFVAGRAPWPDARR